MMINIDIPFEFYQIVYLITDVDQKPYMVIGVNVCADGGTLIELQQEKHRSCHYIGEISADRNTLTQIT